MDSPCKINFENTSSSFTPSDLVGARSQRSQEPPTRTSTQGAPFASPSAAESALECAVVVAAPAPRRCEGNQSYYPQLRVSFRAATVGAVTIAVLLSCLGMFVPLEHFTTKIQRNTISSCQSTVNVQRKLIALLLYKNVTEDAYTSLLSSLSVMVDRFVKAPADQAVDALWGEMRTHRGFDPTFTGKTREQRMALAYNSWVELSAQSAVLKGSVVNFGPYTAAERRSVHPHSLYVGFDTEEFTGAYSSSSDDQQPSYHFMDAEGCPPGDRTTVKLYSVESGTGRCIEPPLKTFDYMPTERPYYTVQAQIAEEARRSPGGAASVFATRAWSGVYKFEEDGIGTSWTAPVSFCGDYSCLEGVVAADITLGHVSFDCRLQWAKLQALLEDRENNFIIGEENSSIFIVQHVSWRFPSQQGLLVGSSSKLLAMVEGELTQAEASPQAVVRGTARAILEKFSEWNATELQSQQRLFTYRLSRITDPEPVLEPCDRESTDVGLDLDCLQVGTRSLVLDGETRWLVVAAFPVDAFGKQAAQVAQHVDAEVARIERGSEVQVEEARTLGLGIFFGMTVLSVVLGVGLGVLVSRPLRKLSELMRRLGDLDFAHHSPEFAELRSGRHSHIGDVSKLQSTFCSLSRGIEAFSRFVPETVVRNIVRGDPKATKVSVSRREVSIMFSDIKDFTRIAEELPQRDLLFVLTRYLSVMTRIVELFGGVVAEILGDGLLVFWNTPDEVEDHAAKACAAALAQMQALVLLNGELARLDLPELSIRIGLNTGAVLSGNIGSEMKMKFGCLGEPVSLANRLESLCKLYGVGIICSGATHAALPSHAGFFCRKLDVVQVKTNAEPIAIYQVIGREGPMDEGEPQAADRQVTGNMGRHKQDTHPFRACTLTSADAASVAVDPTPRGPATRLSPGARPCDVVTPEQRWRAQVYEAAFSAYQKAEFEDAEQVIAKLLDDPEDLAAKTLAERICKNKDMTNEERANWSGVHYLS